MPFFDILMLCKELAGRFGSAEEGLKVAPLEEKTLEN